MFSITELVIKNLNTYLSKANIDSLIPYFKYLRHFLKAGGVLASAPYAPLTAFFIRGRNILLQKGEYAPPFIFNHQWHMPLMVDVELHQHGTAPIF